MLLHNLLRQSDNLCDCQMCAPVHRYVSPLTAPVVSGLKGPVSTDVPGVQGSQKVSRKDQHAGSLSSRDLTVPTETKICDPGSQDRQLLCNCSQGIRAA